MPALPMLSSAASDIFVFFCKPKNANLAGKSAYDRGRSSRTLAGLSLDCVVRGKPDDVRELLRLRLHRADRGPTGQAAWLLRRQHRAAAGDLLHPECVPGIDRRLRR